MYEPTAKLSDRSKPQGEQDRKPRVAAYCRVSTETEEQQGSFKTQVDYYTGLLQNNPEYEFVGIY
ncbi:MAG: recombinase family protein, partial [Bacilli bacterium]|nr:recombinase family protein [Bacilli bacterium]